MEKSFRPQKLIGSKLTPSDVQSTERDCIVYALGVGFGQNPYDTWDLTFVHEQDQNFKVFPQYICALIKHRPLEHLLQSENMPKFNQFKVLHGEFRSRVVRTLKPQGRYYTEGQLVTIQDKKKFGNFIFEFRIFQVTSQKRLLAATVESSLILFQLGGCGNHGKAYLDIPKIPKVSPQITLKAKISQSQALMYRMSGDLNQLHIDKQAAKFLKFQKPIMHGLGTSGIVLRILLKNLFKGDPQLIDKNSIKFIGHVFPGQELNILVWQREEGYIYYVETCQKRRAVIQGHISKRAQAKL